MILLDAYALIAFIAGRPGASEVGSLLRSGHCALTTLNLAEALDVLERVRSVPAERALEAIDPLLESALETVPLDAEIAKAASSVRVDHYHRRDRPLSMADCVLLASGSEGDRVATADRHVLAVAEAIGLDPIELPGDE